MKTWHDVSEGMGEAWDHFTDGWRKFFRRTGRALTRYSPAKGGKLTREESQQLSVRSTGWGVLACEVFDDDDRVVVRLEAPGMETNDFDLQVVNDYLVVRGEKQMARESTEGGFHISECAYGRFERAIPLPDEVDAGKASAKYKHGVLRVELPKTTQRQRTKVAVH